MFAGSRPTALLIARWRAKGALRPLQAGAALLDDEQAANAFFRSLWRVAFPTRAALPKGAIATQDGRFTDRMLNIWL